MFHRFRWVTKCLALVGLLLGSSLALSAVEVALYEEQIVVSMNADQNELNGAIREGLSRVFVRVTGMESITEEDAVKEALTRSQNFISASRFAASEEFFTNILGERVPTKRMVLTYDRKQVEDFLVRNRLPVWREFRPEVVVWVADRSEGFDRLLADSDNNAPANALRQAAQRRGVPIVLPLMDLEDTLNVTFADVFGLFSSDIETASARYSPDAILAGRVNQVGEQFQGDWLFLFKGERIRLPTVVGDEQEVMSAAIDLAAQRLTRQYAFIFDPALVGTYSLIVNNVLALQQLAEVEQYLKSINIITRVSLRSLTETAVAFDIQISGDRTQLVDVFELDKLLLPVDALSFETQMERRLEYTWSR